MRFYLKNQDPMAVIASAEFVAELDGTVWANPTRSTQMLRRVADLLAVTARRPIEGAV